MPNVASPHSLLPSFPNGSEFGEIDSSKNAFAHTPIGELDNQGDYDPTHALPRDLKYEERSRIRLPFDTRLGNHSLYQDKGFAQPRSTAAG